MNKLLIHSQNTALSDENYFNVSEQILLFESNNEIDDVDRYIHHTLFREEVVKKILNADIIFIKLGLSDNYLEYYGLRIAYHIRLTKVLKDKSLLPIIFIGEESIQFIGLTAEMPEILFTGGVYLMNDTKKDFERMIKRFESNQIKPLNSIESFIEKIKVLPPANYLSNHSIDNEWSILNWAKMLNLSNDTGIIKIADNIEVMLYYKYLMKKNKLVGTYSSEGVQTYRISKLDSKILYIDDDWNKGWKVILTEILRGGNSSNFQTLELEYKTLDYTSIENNFKKKLEIFDPDIVILDLRLHDKDFIENLNIEEFSGLKFLKFIKNKNPGIQVAIFSSTNKIKNLIGLQNKGADSFLFKSSTDNNYDKVILNFKNSIEFLQEKVFIKKMIEICYHIDELLKKANENDFEQYDYDEFILDLQAKNKINIFNLSKINLEIKNTINITFLCFFNFLESFKNYFFKKNTSLVGYDELAFICYSEDKKGQIFKNSIIEYSWTSCTAFLYIEYFELLSMNDSFIQSLFHLNRRRNDFIHKKITNFSKDELIKIVDLSELICTNLKN
ncbi:response regulator [Chryseobacterium sp. KLBC 52]|uniref:response regulator n=1 Tax=Chryseobacterium sp. KLBC 52 TaxID=1862702 RepID=UPI000E09FBC1|nr:response regulator [Chryseobacterium sp. KLBC 52]